MTVLSHIRLLAKYNQWMNEKLYETAATVAKLPRFYPRRALMWV